MEIAATEAARRGVGHLTKAAENGPVMVTKHGHATSVVLSARDYEHLVAAARRERHASSAEELAVIMRQRREELGLTVGQVASRAEVGRRFVWDLEHGVQRPEYPMMLDVARVLDVVLLSFPARPVGPWTQDLADAMSDEVPDEQ